VARPALANLDDLEAALGGPVADSQQAESLLARASAIVRAFAGKTWTTTDDDDEEVLDVVPPDIPGVVVGMVERATRNPDGVTQVQETAGPFSLGRSFGSDAAGRIYLTAMDKLVIRAAVGSTGVGTLTMTRGPLETPDVSECTADGYSGITEADNPYSLWP
jgi:hypothetical protein